MENETHSEASALDPAAFGLRAITRWVPDTSDPVFMAKYTQQRAVIAASMTPGRESEAEFWEKAQSHEGWT